MEGSPDRGREGRCRGGDAEGGAGERFGESMRERGAREREVGERCGMARTPSDANNQTIFHRQMCHTINK